MKKFIIILSILISCHAISSAQTILYDDFSNPDNWDIKVYTSDPTIGQWTIGQNSTKYMDNIKSKSGGNYALFDSDTEGEYEEQDAAVLYNYPVFVKAGQELHLRFLQNFKQWNDEVLYLLFYTENGTKLNYKTLNSDFAWNDSTSNPDTVDIDLTEFIEHDDSIYFGFEYYSSMGNNYAWFIDDVRLYYPSTDAEVTGISTLGKLPIKYNTPHKIKTRISNIGSTMLKNVPVTLKITGANTFTNIKTLDSIDAWESTVVEFDAFSPDKLGVNNVQVSLPDDDYSDNNEKNFRQEVTYNTYSYADTTKVNYSIGRSEGQPGIISVKYHINHPKTVQQVRLCLGTDTWAVGKPIFAVLMNSNGKIIAQSKDYIIKADDLGKYISLPLDTFPVLANTDFFVGIAQPEAGHEFYPIGSQYDENPIFDTVNYYSTDLIASDLIPSGLNSRRMIEAVLGDPTPEICLVTADLETAKNMIVWERYPSGSIKYYKIYRENNIAGKFDSIGFVNYDKFSVFIDQTAIPEKRQYAYKISFVDTMNVESPKSAFHKTLFLQFGGTIGGVNLNWQKYEVEGRELQFDSYVLYRGTDSTKLEPFDTIPASFMASKDKRPDALIYRTYYRIAGLLTNGCDPTGTLKASGDIYSQSMSNMEDNRLRTTGINTLANDIQLNIFPNPFTSKTSISFELRSVSDVSVEIFDVLGRKVSTIANETQLAGKYKYDFVSPANSTTLYYLRLTIGNNVITKRLMQVK